MLFRQPSRPFDPTGLSLLNNVVGEVHTLAPDSQRLFHPTHGSFYTESVVVSADGVLLRPKLDYRFLVLHRKATMATGKEVGCIIKILKSGVSKVSVDYQAVGGDYANVVDVIIEMVNDGVLNKSGAIRWDEILEKPTEFNPSSHAHPYWGFNGWIGWLDPLSKINNGILFRKLSKVEEVYEYAKSKFAVVNTKWDNIINTKTTEMKNAITASRDPIGLVNIFTKAINPESYKSGTWMMENNYVFMAGGNSAQVGDVVGVSEDITFPQPDNILLTSEDVPILRDDNEWLYLDNNNPVYPGVDLTYDEEFDEQFNLNHVRAWSKVSHDPIPTTSIKADKVSMVEGETVVFTLTTTGYDAGTTFQYMLSGVSSDNVNKPVYGVLTVGANGEATLSVELLVGGPRTSHDTMTIEILALNTTKTSVKYTLAANAVYLAKTYLTSGYNSDKLDKLVVGEFAYLLLRTRGLAGKSVTLSAAFTGEHSVSLVGYSQTNGVWSIPITADGDMYIQLQTTQVGVVNPNELNVVVKYDQTQLDSFTVPSELLDIKASWLASKLNQTTTTVVDGELFKLQVSHNSRLSLYLEVVTVSNTAQSFMVYPLPKSIYATPYTTTPSNDIAVDRTITTKEDTITVDVVSPYNSDVKTRCELKVLAK